MGSLTGISSDEEGGIGSVAVEVFSVGINVDAELASVPKYEDEAEDWDSSLVAVLDMFALSSPVPAGLGTGESGAGLKRLPSPLAITPGCIPRNGVSRFMVPMIRWPSSKATSAERMPPML